MKVAEHILGIWKFVLLNSQYLVLKLQVDVLWSTVTENGCSNKVLHEEPEPEPPNEMKWYLQGAGGMDNENLSRLSFVAMLKSRAASRAAVLGRLGHLTVAF